MRAIKHSSLVEAIDARRPQKDDVIGTGRNAPPSTATAATIRVGVSCIGVDHSLVRV